MSSIHKKALCLFSGAVLLFGAGSITANAQDTTASQPVRLTGSPTAQNTDYYLAKTSFTLAKSEEAFLEVKSGKSLASGVKLSYQWYKDGVAIVGAVSKTYSAKATGEYYCIVTESDGSSASSISMVGRLGSVKPSGSSSGSSAASAESLIGAVRQTTNAQITSLSKTYTTNTAAVTVLSDLKITAQPKGGIICGNYYGDRCILSIGVSGGDGEYEYSWTCDGVPVEADSASISAETAGEYVCTVTSADGGKLVSQPATVTEDLFSVSACLKKHMSALVRCNEEYIPEGTALKLSVKASGGTGKYTYTWEKYYSYINGEQETGCWLPLNSNTDSVTLERDDIIYTATNYDESYNSWTSQVYETKVRCIVSCLDENGNVAATRYTNEAVISADDSKAE